MKLEEIVIYRRQKYKKKCSSCGINHLILTQRDDDPEYHTDIYLQCKCGEFIEFILPVN